MKKKSTAAEMQLRTKEVQDLLLSGHTYSAIQEYGLKWEISSRQIDDYISGARKMIEEVNLLSLKENQALIANALWNEYRSAKDSRDRINVLKELARIHGVGNVNLIVSVSEARPYRDFTDEELEALDEQSKSGPN